MDLNLLNGWLILAVGIALASIGWAYRKQDARIERAETKLSDFELYCAKTFVTSNAMEKALDNLNKTIGAVFDKLDRIEDKLDKKVDKP